MRKSKTDIPLIIFDKRVPDTYTSNYQEQAGPLSEKKRRVDQEQPMLLLEIILQRLFQGLQRLLIALKHRLFVFLRQIFGGMDIPWFKITLLLLLAYVLLAKDMQFNVALQAPMGFIGTEQEKGNAQTAAYQSDLAPASAAMIKNEKAEQFIKRYAPLAVAEMKKYDIPASIKMAQALIESRAGQSRLATQSNNHFGIKCKARCRGCTCRNYADDGAYDMFRVFENPWESWREHSKLLQIDRYKGLKKYKKDYHKWAKGLKKAGYATDKNYAQKLIEVIEQYQLYKLDKL